MLRMWFRGIKFESSDTGGVHGTALVLFLTGFAAAMIFTRASLSFTFVIWGLAVATEVIFFLVVAVLMWRRVHGVLYVIKVPRKRGYRMMAKYIRAWRRDVPLVGERIPLYFGHSVPVREVLYAPAQVPLVYFGRVRDGVLDADRLHNLGWVEDAQARQPYERTPARLDTYERRCSMQPTS